MEHTPTGCLAVVAGVGVEGHKAINGLFPVFCVHPIATGAESNLWCVGLLCQEYLKALFLGERLGSHGNGSVECMLRKLCAVREPDTFGGRPGIRSMAYVKYNSHSSSLPLLCRASMALRMTSGIGSPISPAFSMMLMVSFAM